MFKDLSGMFEDFGFKLVAINKKTKILAKT